ncbi:hypothetical protein MKI84_08655 [Ancylobacter sp. A5.8]|uniref:cellulose biosynthesis protein BcsS n=1 Tax=Ancylobacter gelatini TaxID=2919920 RepID=UPI001F4EEAF6|nr:cellulose biosynthesis protein BcsS [Ancylobacter gelatini]MCJ8142986.1 hypothetical protein [Ancylobacter gelatini]
MRRARRRAKDALVIGLLAAGGFAMPAVADELSDQTPPSHFYFYSGVDVARDTSYGWAGAAWAPFGPMDREGFRLRAQAGIARRHLLQ